MRCVKTMAVITLRHLQRTKSHGTQMAQPGPNKMLTGFQYFGMVTQIDISDGLTKFGWPATNVAFARSLGVGAMNAHKGVRAKAREAAKVKVMF